jgi:hypothetical protein
MQIFKPRSGQLKKKREAQRSKKASKFLLVIYPDNDH